jgi:GNAT superfamily N-acetyltransferase
MLRYRVASIKEMAPGQAPAARRLIEKVLREHGLWQDHKCGIGTFDGYLLVVEENGKVAGCGGLRPVDKRTVEVTRMYLDRRLRGQGLGKALLARLLERARKQGFKRAVLESSTRFERAIRLYAKAGFKGVIVDTDNCCNVRMEISLKARATPADNRPS